MTAEYIIYALVYANAHRPSIEAARQELQGAPTGNRLQEVGARISLDRLDRFAACTAAFSVIKEAKTANGNGSFSGTFTAPPEAGTYSFRAIFLQTRSRRQYMDASDFGLSANYNFRITKAEYVTLTPVC